ncbi:MAG: MerC domain-containing protein [Bacteroidota bacterium]
MNKPGHDVGLSDISKANNRTTSQVYDSFPHEFATKLSILFTKRNYVAFVLFKLYLQPNCTNPNMSVILNKKSDELGMLSSTLCIIHCVATPFVFVAVPGSSVGAHGSQALWGWLDLLFLAISFIAVFKTYQQSTLRWIKTSLIVSWLMLTFFIFNERLEGIAFPFDMVYVPAVALIILHLVNRRQCRCETGCCENNQPADGKWMTSNQKNVVES